MSAHRPSPRFNPQVATREVLGFSLGAFLSFALICAWAAQHGGLERNPLLVPLGMCTPMFSAIVVQKLTRRPVLGIDGLGFRLGRLCYWVLTPASCVVLVILSFLLSYLITPGLLASGSEIDANTGKLRLPVADLGLPLTLVIAFGLTLFIGPVLNLPIFLGEEVGWRGFLNPRLIALLGRPGLLLGGAVWAVWHLPVILLGHNYPHHPWLGLWLWIPICVCLNIFLEAARQASGSIFPPALAHGIINQTAMLILLVYTRDSDYEELLHGPAGLSGLLVLILPAIWIYCRFDKETGILIDKIKLVF